MKKQYHINSIIREQECFFLSQFNEMNQHYWDNCVRVRSDRGRFSVHSPFIEKSMMIPMASCTHLFIANNFGHET